jgi:hypothetical protein
MFVPKTREEALGSVQKEVRSEQANALGRVGRRLEGFLEELEEIERALRSRTGADRLPLLSLHAEARKQATQYRWYLEVQREAMGLRQHADLELYYPVPPAINE